MSGTREAPAWLFRPLPANAVEDRVLAIKIDELVRNLPTSLGSLRLELNTVQATASYEHAVNAAVAGVWLHLDAMLEAPDPKDRLELLSFAVAHFPTPAAARVCRRLAKDPLTRVRERVRAELASRKVREVALSATKDGPWDATGWLKGTTDVDLSRHKTGKKVQTRNNVPEIADLAGLRKLLAIRSPNQLGWFLLATDAEDGPYTKFTIPKRGGEPRTICAPKPQLKWVQRRILEMILAKVPAHPAAHGFVEGRSTVTNAAHHRGAVVVVKFDLKDFFPTIHYFRVLGLFASLGYPVGNAKFGTKDRSFQIAPALARLCCYTPDPKAWGTALLPQGAPTSPALSNLVCRRLDSRLDGLAKKLGGTYTRYADDLTFSFKAEIPNLGRLRWWVDQVCHQEGFVVNHAKYRVIRASQRQLVTGIVVNTELRVPREDRRAFRAVLHNCRKHGVESQARGNPRFAAYLRGFASYVHMIHPDEGTDLMKQVDALLGGNPEMPVLPNGR